MILEKLSQKNLILVCDEDIFLIRKIIKQISELYLNNSICAWAVFMEKQKDLNENICQSCPHKNSSENFLTTLRAVQKANCDILIIENIYSSKIAQEIFQNNRKAKIISGMQSSNIPEAIIQLVNHGIDLKTLNIKNPAIINKEKIFEFTPEISSVLTHPRLTRRMLEEVFV